MAALLDILDSELRLWHADKSVRSPGYALLEGQNYHFGNAARSTARMQPRNINNRFWWQLSTRELQPALGPARHTADLVHGHLLELHQQGGSPAGLVLAVPDSLQREQLSLLLGIVRACPFEVVGLVNRSLLAADGHGGAGTVFHLELQLHQALLTELRSEGGERLLVGSQTLPGRGLLSLQEAIVEKVATAFISGTRFDPRRKAETEQALYDALPQLLTELRDNGEGSLEVGGYRARVAWDELREVSRPLLDKCAQLMQTQPDALVLLDPLADLAPGLSAGLSRVHVISTNELPQALARHRALIEQTPEELHLIKGLPLGVESTGAHRSTPARTQSSAADATQPAPASHILHGAQARPLRDSSMPLQAGWELRRHASGAWQLAGGQGGARINGNPAGSQLLGAGDRIELADGQQQWLLIHVQD